ncbi:MAG: hypothetical protein J1F12_03920 [Muribaculaceae bacterium]|nr:hypothetical protein [Muribaculaceae bacterium]
MVSFMRFIFLCCLCLLAACGKNQFTLEFKLESDITENYNVTFYDTDKDRGGVTVQAVASVREGVCMLDGVTKLPTLVYITPRKKTYPLVIYAEKGSRIEISGTGNYPLEWQVKGNKINEEISNWREKNLDFLLNNQTDSINNRVEEYVRQNPENPVAAILLGVYFDRTDYENEYLKLRYELKGEARSSYWKELLGRSDLFEQDNYLPARLESVIMRSINRGVDTFSLNNNPGIVFFWQTGYAQRNNMIDSIKAISKEFPDSITHIADICLDIDSVGWRNAMKKDSLENIKRFWAPSGLNDPTVRKFRVKRIPYVIVFGKEGQQEYRGDELSEALEKYRMLMNEKDSLSEKNKK